MIRQPARRIAGAAALLLSAYLATLAFLFPADIAWRAAEARLELPVTIAAASVSGRIWNGRADGLTVDGQPAGTVHWRLQPAALLRGRLGLALRWQSGNDHVDARVRLGARGVQAMNVAGGLDAPRIQAWFHLPLLLDGRLELDLPGIGWVAESGFTDADGTLLWAGAGAGLPRPLPLGQYRAEISAADGALVAWIDSGPGSVLTAEGTASWHPAGDYRVDLELSTSPNADRNLLAALDSIAQRRSDGSHRLQLHHGYRASEGTVRHPDSPRQLERPDPATPAASDIFELP